MFPKDNTVNLACFHRCRFQRIRRHARSLGYLVSHPHSTRVRAEGDSGKALQPQRLSAQTPDQYSRTPCVIAADRCLPGAAPAKPAAEHRPYTGSFGSRAVPQSIQASLRESFSPLAHRWDGGLQLGGYLLNFLPIQASQNDARSFYRPHLFRPAFADAE